MRLCFHYSLFYAGCKGLDFLPEDLYLSVRAVSSRFVVFLRNEPDFYIQCILALTGAHTAGNSNDRSGNALKEAFLFPFLHIEI